jgi:radical SAM protein with 4Fe4S-binding SPASM domain
MNGMRVEMKSRTLTEQLLQSACHSKRENTAIMNTRHLISSLPILILMPHSRCDCRCLMCDIWKRPAVQEISEAQLKQHLNTILKMGVRWVIFSGGEPLLHSQLFVLCGMLREKGIQVTLLSTGQRLKELSLEVSEHTDGTILSLDGPEPVHDTVRRVKGAFAQMKEGIPAVRRFRPQYSFSGRVTVQRVNFSFLRETVRAGRTLGLDSLSFLAVDANSNAFNRPTAWDARRQQEVLIPPNQLSELEEEIENLIREFREDIHSGFIRESPEKLRRIAHHFRVLVGEEASCSPRCNAPWVSTVIEANGEVRPCFFHDTLGNIHEQELSEILNGPKAMGFRETLDVETNPICQRCVCSLYLPNGTRRAESHSDSAAFTIQARVS